MKLPLGDGVVRFDLPDSSVTVIEPPGAAPVNLRRAASDALDSPHGPRLRDVADPDDSVAVVVTDVTRPTPDEALVDAMLDRLPGRHDRVSIVIGLGLHRPMSHDERRQVLGEFAPLAVNHDPDDAVRVGEIPRFDGDGTVPVEVHSAVAEADVVLSAGLVEPHQYAGFSGGAKTVVVGAGGDPLIRYTHGPDMLSQDGVRLGRVEDNPFREAVDAAGDVAGPQFCLNVARGPRGVFAVSAGEPRAVVGDLALAARDAFSVDVDGTYDAVVAGVGAPKDANLYQATRAATYVIFGDENPLRPGGRVVIPATLSEGAGQGTGEQRFYERLANADSAEHLYEEMREGYDPGAQRAFLVARALMDYDIYVTDSEDPAVVEECLMHAADTVEDAVEPGSDVLVLPDALNTLLTV